jgi:hypothetical protein
MTTDIREARLEWIFRAGLAMCFIGHGAFGFITKAEWLPFFGLVGISPEVAFTLMPVIGAIDVALGVLVLIRPMRGAVLYMAVWAAWTALLRPLTGDSVFEALERAGNYGVPLAFLLLLGPARGLKGWFGRATPVPLTDEREAQLWRVLSGTTALLLVGHGGLALAQKGVLVSHAGLIGLGSESVMLAGVVEIALAIVVLFAPRPSVLLGVAAWKLGTETLYPLAGAPVWELIERGGSYAAPLLLAILATRRIASGRTVGPRIAGSAAVAAAIIFAAAAPSRLLAQHSHDDTADRVPVAPAGILDSLRVGGYVIACRHAATNHNESDRGPAREQQRNLSSLGEEQSRTIATVIRERGIRIGEVRSNPMYRNRETAEYAFGSAIPDSTLMGGKGLRRFLSAPVPAGANRALVVRQGTIYDGLKEWGVTRTSEGDCFIARPTSDGFTMLGRLRVADWVGPAK